MKVHQICGMRNEDDARYCVRCGAQLEDDRGPDGDVQSFGVTPDLSELPEVGTWNKQFDDASGRSQWDAPEQSTCEQTYTRPWAESSLSDPPIQLVSQVQPNFAAGSGSQAWQPTLEQCPSCGTWARQGARFCPKCRYDFVAGVATLAPAIPSTPPLREAWLQVGELNADAPGGRAVWPSIVIIIAVTIIVVSLFVIGFTLAGQAHAATMA